MDLQPDAVAGAVEKAFREGLAFLLVVDGGFIAPLVQDVRNFLVDFLAVDARPDQ